ncbi:MAG: complement resistance protein TraT [Arcobacteraceae bacterium]|jgi:outer membrane lipoprotein SlyB|nr:complement resistance protein TraT [Arcobacteraceae bacterium]MDY0327158.1 complement resistance protein TraT [Arcobacteraceae bacterium]
MTISKRLVVSTVLASLLLGGCATTELQTSAKMTQSIFINPVAKSKRTIFVASRNTSGQNINLENKILNNIESKGYKVVEDPEQATYILMINVLYCDKKMENNAAGGAAAAGIAGASVGAYNSNSGGSIAGATIGAAVVGGLLAKLTEDTIYQMQVDILIREKANGKVITLNTNTSGQASVNDEQKAGFMNTFAGSVKNVDATGNLNSNLNNANTQQYETDFIEHKTMLFAEATKMKLTLSEAIPILEDKISSQISGLF